MDGDAVVVDDKYSGKVPAKVLRKAGVMGIIWPRCVSLDVALSRGCAPPSAAMGVSSQG